MNRDAYRTPPELFAALDAVYNFSADVAASAENALCSNYFTEQDNALAVPLWATPSESEAVYVWCNPPYSDIGPWVRKAAEQWRLGIGCVMLVMADTSVGWYAEAIKTCYQVGFVVGGRISFLCPETGKPVNGNNKGSMFLIWEPLMTPPAYGPKVDHIDRSYLLACGKKALEQKINQPSAA